MLLAVNPRHHQRQPGGCNDLREAQDGMDGACGSLVSEMQDPGRPIDTYHISGMLSQSRQSPII